jgi:hypothetical protein
MAARAPDWFEAVKSPNGWTYTINPADRQPSPWPTWSRWLLGAFTIGLIVIGVGLLGSCVAMTSGFAWDGTRVVYGIGGLAYLVGGAGLAIVQLRRRTGRCELRLDAGAIRAIWCPPGLRLSLTSSSGWRLRGESDPSGRHNLLSVSIISMIVHYLLRSSTDDSKPGLGKRAHLTHGSLTGHPEPFSVAPSSPVRS